MKRLIVVSMQLLLFVTALLMPQKQVQGQALVNDKNHRHYTIEFRFMGDVLDRMKDRDSLYIAANETFEWWFQESEVADTPENCPKHGRQSYDALRPVTYTCRRPQVTVTRKDEAQRIDFKASDGDGIYHIIVQITTPPPSKPN